MERMLWEIVSCVISTGVGMFIGGLIKNLKGHKQQFEAIKCLTRSSLVSQYYVYKDLEKVPVHVKENWNMLYDSYVAMGGNSFVTDDIKPKWDDLEIE